MEDVVSTTWPRHDGCYVALIDQVWEYLRFFPDGLVATVSSDLPPEVFASHIVPEVEAISYGRSHYQCCLCVTTENDEGAVEYRIESGFDESLIVHSHSHVNGSRFTTIYRFFPL